MDPLNSIAELSESNNKAFKTLSIDPQNFDSDGDGLTDWDETNGMRTAFGTIKTDPSDPDTDGDGLNDGEEMGKRYTDYYYMDSNPTLVDSDSDGLYDLDESLIGTNALNSDTDGDQIIDSIDKNPLVKDISPILETVLEIARAVVLGAAFGETGIEGGSLHYLVGKISSSVYYLTGWIGFSLIPVVGALADIRDAVQAFINGDMLGAALNAAGAIPGPGDAVKVAGVVGLFIKVNPGKVGDTAKTLMRVFKKFAPDVIKIKILDALYSGAATVLTKYGFSISKIEELVEKGTDLTKITKGIDLLKSNDVSTSKIMEALQKGKDLFKLNNALNKAATIPKIGNVGVNDIIHILVNEKINIDETLGFIKRSGGSVSWFEIGKLSDASKRALDAGKWIVDKGGSGWKHIKNNHVINPGGNQFLRYGQKYADELKIQNLIMESVKNGKKIIQDGDIWHVYEVPNSGGKILSTLVGSNGYIVSIRPQTII